MSTKLIPCKTIFDVVELIRKEGPPKSVDRLRLMLLIDSIDEGINFAKIEKSSECSRGYLNKAKDCAKKILQECNRA